MTTTQNLPSVLLAEDNPTTAALMRRILIDLGYPTVSVSDGAAAWAAFQANPAQIVLTDWVMPGMDGIELCERIRAMAGDECIVIVVTSRDACDDLRLALGAGVDDYITKPIVREHLRARLLIAERRLVLAKARRDAERELARMRWLAGIGQTVLTFQHEINNPLTALYGHLELILEDSTTSLAVHDEAIGALSQAERIANIVTHLATTRQHSVVEPIAGQAMLAVGTSPFAVHEDSAPRSS